MIEYDYAELFLQDTVPKDLVITDGTVTVSGTHYSVSGQTVLITNDLLELEKFTLTQRLSQESQLTFGSCNAAMCEFTMHDNIPSIKDKQLKVYMYLNRDASTMLQIGKFKVFNDTLDGDTTARRITAYDALYDILNADVTAWYNTLLPSASSTTTVSAMRASFFSYFGVQVVSTTLINDWVSVGKTIQADRITGSMVLHAICEINGVFGVINNEGKFKFVELSAGIDDGLFPAEDLYPADDLYPQDVNPNVTPITKHQYFNQHFEDYLAEAITKLTIRNGGNGSVSVGTDGNTYVVDNNFLLYDKTSAQLTTIANNMLTKIVNRYYKPCSIGCIGNPCHEVGDPIRINTVYRGVVTYILERKLTGIQALKDEYTAKGVKHYDENVNSISTQIKRMNGTVASLQVETDRIESSVENLDSRTSSSISQLSSEISAKVSQTGGSASTFGWSLTSNGFKLQSDGGTVLDCDRNGIEVAGSIVSDGSYGICKVYDGRVDVSSDGTDNSDYVHMQSMRGGGPSVGGWKSGSGMFLIAPGNVAVYDNNNKRFYVTPSEFEWNGHELTFIEIPDANGVIRHVLGY